MASFVCSCPHCGRKFTAQAEWIGRKSDCPECGNPFVIENSSPATDPDMDGTPEDDFGDSLSMTENGDGFFSTLRQSRVAELLGNLRGTIINLAVGMFVILGILCASCGILLHIRMENRGQVLWISGIGALFYCCLMALVGKKLLELSPVCLGKARHTLSSYAILDCFFLFLITGGMISIVSGIFLACKTESIGIFYQLGMAGLLQLMVGLMTLCPQALNINRDPDSSLGQDFISIAMFQLKALLAVLPYLWLANLLVIGLNLIVRLGADKELLLLVYWSSMPGVIAVGLAPLALYLMFLLVQFFFEICSCILRIPAYLEKLTEEK